MNDKLKKAIGLVIIFAAAASTILLTGEGDINVPANDLVDGLQDVFLTGSTSTGEVMDNASGIQ